LVIARAEGRFAEYTEEGVFGSLLVFGFNADEENGAGRDIRVEEEFGAAAAKANDAIPEARDRDKPNSKPYAEPLVRV
jgi:hypothetical protein